MSELIADLKSQIEAKYGSIYKFCKANPQVKRATAYLVLKGTYPGKILKQAAILQAILQNENKTNLKEGINQHKILDILQKHKCNNCRLLNKNCMTCKQNTEKEAEAVFLYVLARV